jgi:hypothetical protein
MKITSLPLIGQLNVGAGELILIVALLAPLIALLLLARRKGKTMVSLLFPAEQTRRHWTFAIAGFLVGALLGFLLRPSVPLVGQLPFTVVITRGSNLQGLDRVLVSTACTSSNYMFFGGIIVAFVGLGISYSAKGKARCLECGGVVVEGARKCLHCGSAIERILEIRCPFCGERGRVRESLLSDQVECPACKKAFPASSAPT